MKKEKFLQEVARLKATKTNLKTHKIMLSAIDDIRDSLSMAYLEDEIYDRIDEAASKMVEARDIFRFDMMQNLGTAEDELNRLKEELSALGVDTPPEVSELENEIFDKERRIVESRGAIQKSLRQIARIDDVPLIEHFLAGTAFSEAWEAADQLRRVQTVLSDEVLQLEAIRDSLEIDARTVAAKQGQLVSFKRELSGQKSILDQNRQQQTRQRLPSARHYRIAQRGITNRRQRQQDRGR